MADIITETSDPEMWASLHSLWESEKRPGWVVAHAGGQQWLVVQKTDGSIEFHSKTQMEYYDSTSFKGSLAGQ